MERSLCVEIVFCLTIAYFNVNNNNWDKIAGIYPSLSSNQRKEVLNASTH
jgi:hypothetical protein